MYHDSESVKSAEIYNILSPIVVM